MNTRVSYHYADKTNCQQYTSIVVSGTITWEQIGIYLVDQRSFIPGQIGLEDLQYRFALPGQDHPWHQIAPKDIRPTEAAPTMALTAEELASRFADRPWFVSRMPAPTPQAAPVSEPAPSAPAAERRGKRRKAEIDSE